jgi:hypothetical protein
VTTSFGRSSVILAMADRRKKYRKQLFSGTLNGESNSYDFSSVFNQKKWKEVLLGPNKVVREVTYTQKIR